MPQRSTPTTSNQKAADMELMWSSRRDRALRVMDYFERKERTSSEWYKLAQRISIKEVFNQMAYDHYTGQFNVRGCQSGRFCGAGEPNIPASDPNILSRVQGLGYITANSLEE